MNSTILYITALIFFVIGVAIIVFSSKKFKRKEKIKEKMIVRNTLSLKDKVEITVGKNSSANVVNRYFFNVKLMMSKMGKLEQYNKVKLFAFVGALIGALLAAVIQNPFLALIFMPVGFFVPFEYIKSKQRKYNQEIEKELENALSLITISYTKTESIVASVEECIDSLPPIIKGYFEDFLMEVKNIDANVVSGLITLKTRIENRTFQQWIDRVIICQENRSAISTLQNYVEEFATNRSIQSDLDAEVYSAKTEMYLMIGMALLTPLLLYFVQKEAFTALITTLPGKLTMFFSTLMVVIVYFIGSKITKPVKFRGNKD